MIRLTVRAKSQGSIPAKKLSKKATKALKELTKRMKRDAISKDCIGFTHPSEKNIVLMGEPDEYITVKGHVSNEDLVDFDYNHAEGAKSILINIGHGMYKKLSIKTYKKLSKILYIAIRVKATVLKDESGDDYDYETVMDTTYDIPSLNQLFSILAKVNGIVEGRSAFQISQEGWNTVNETDVIVKILHSNDMVEILSLHKFLDKYKLYY